MELSRYIDHTLLKPTATPEDIIKLCDEAKEYNFYAVCVNPGYVATAKKELVNSKIKIAAVVGFPLGANSTQTKVFEAKLAIKEGANEIDMVLNIGFLKSKMYGLVQDEIAAVRDSIGDRTLKVILETCYLTNEEIRKACQICKNAKADFVKTSTGFGNGGATEEAIKLMLEEVGNTLKIKASGGIKDRGTAKKYIEMGVSRIGTSSGIDIVTSTKNNIDEHTY